MSCIAVVSAESMEKKQQLPLGNEASSVSVSSSTSDFYAIDELSEELHEIRLKAKAAALERIHVGKSSPDVSDLQQETDDCGGEIPATAEVVDASSVRSLPKDYVLKSGRLKIRVDRQLDDVPFSVGDMLTKISELNSARQEQIPVQGTTSAELGKPQDNSPASRECDSSSGNLFDTHYFGDFADKTSQSNEVESITPKSFESSGNIFEEQYFESLTATADVDTATGGVRGIEMYDQYKKQEVHPSDVRSPCVQSGTDYLDQQYFTTIGEPKLPDRTPCDNDENSITTGTHQATSPNNRLVFYNNTAADRSSLANSESVSKFQRHEQEPYKTQPNHGSSKKKSDRLIYSLDDLSRKAAVYAENFEYRTADKQERFKLRSERIRKARAEHAAASKPDGSEEQNMVALSVKEYVNGEISTEQGDSRIGDILDKPALDDTYVPLLESDEIQANPELSFPPQLTADKVAAMTNVVKQTKAMELQRIAAVDRDGSLRALHKIWWNILPVHKMIREDLIKGMAENVLYNEDDLVALNKPYGLPCVLTTDGHMTVTSLLPHLAKALFPRENRCLRIVKPMDKQISGVLLLAASDLRHSEMVDLIKKKKIVEKSTCITTRVPKQLEVIRIPLRSQQFGNIWKMVPATYVGDSDAQRSSYNHPSRVFPAETLYSVQSESCSCALVSTSAKDCVTHQIRSHFGFGIDCPILGDDKYASSYTSKKTAKPDTKAMRALGIRSTRIRDLPLYLHSTEILLPEMKNGRNVFIRAPLPRYFKTTLKMLKLKF